MKFTGFLYLVIVLLTISSSIGSVVVLLSSYIYDIQQLCKLTSNLSSDECNSESTYMIVGLMNEKKKV